MRKLLPLIAILFFCISISSCLQSDNVYDKYADWRKENDAYMNQRLTEQNPNGTMRYMRIVPPWAPNVLVLMEWHNDTNLTKMNPMPLDNSTIGIKYEGHLIDSTLFDNSYSQKDSLYVTMPKANILGMRAALPFMHIGDSVTMLIASGAAYGSYENGNIKPYSTLIFNVKLVDIYDLTIP